MKAPPLSYRRVSSVEEAVQALAEHGDEAKLLAGGQSLVPMLNFRLAAPSMLVDVGRVEGLRYMEGKDATLRIGALTTHYDVETTSAPAVVDGYEVLTEAATFIGHYPVRTLGTVGGSIAHADPSAEWCVLSLALDAEFVAVGPGGERRIAADDFFLGFLTTALQPDEMLVEARFRGPARHARLVEFSRRHGDFAIVVVAVALDLVDGRCRAARIALGGVESVPLRVLEAERLLVGETWSEELVGEAAATVGRALDPPADIHASSSYRKRLAAALVRRALRRAAQGPAAAGRGTGQEHTEI